MTFQKRNVNDAILHAKQKTKQQGRMKVAVVVAVVGVVALAVLAVGASTADEDHDNLGTCTDPNDCKVSALWETWLMPPILFCYCHFGPVLMLYGADSIRFALWCRSG